MDVMRKNDRQNTMLRHRVAVKVVAGSHIRWLFFLINHITWIWRYFMPNEHIHVIVSMDSFQRGVALSFRLCITSLLNQTALVWNENLCSASMYKVWISSSTPQNTVRLNYIFLPRFIHRSPKSAGHTLVDKVFIHMRTIQVDILCL